MQKCFFQYFLLICCFVLYATIELCSSVSENRTICETYYRDYNTIKCKSHYGKNFTAPFNDIVLLQTACKDANSTEFIKPRAINSKLGYLTFIDCPIRPGIFKDLKVLNVHGFTSKPNNKNPILWNDTFSGLCSLNNIYAKGNGIETIEPGAFKCLKSIQILELSQNKLHFLPPDIFKEMQQLMYLELSDNNFSKFEEGTFDDLVSLKSLTLNSNSIHYLPDLIFEKLKLLRVLKLNNNNIRNLSERHMSNLADLWNLDLSHTTIKELGGLCSNKIYMRELYLAGNNDLILAKDSFYDLKGLFILNLEKCDIAFLPSGIFSNTPQLQRLRLSGNRLQNISSEMFAELRNLKELDLSYNNIFHLTSHLLKHNIKLISLNLMGNVISEIKSDTFQEILHLEELDLSLNRIELLDDCLSGLVKLSNLNLSNNFITYLHIIHPFHSFLSSLTNLKKLDISNNRIEDLQNVFLKNSKVTQLDISKNPYLVLTNNSFTGLTGLNVLYVNYCNMTFVTKGMFMNISKLTRLYMQDNNLREIDSEMFGELSDLALLDVSHNKIISLTNQPFRRNERLQSLFIFQNDLRKIETGDFTGLRRLKKLDISKNSIQEIVNNSFEPLTELEVLNISHNLVLSVSDIVRHCRKLRDIDISHNRIEDIRNKNWHNLLNLESLRASNNLVEKLYLSLIPHSVIHLEHNKVKTIIVNDKDEKNTFLSNKERNPQIYLSRNPIECDCHSYNFYQYLEEKNSLPHVEFVDAVICQSPEELRGKTLRSLTPFDFVCNITQFCPYNCDCKYRAIGEATIVNCNDLKYQHLPTQAPPNTTVLYIQRNDLISLMQLNETVWQNLSEIHADGNRIVNEDFPVPQQLKHLGLSKNKLKGLPSTVEKHTKMVKMFTLALSHNLWTCDCSILPFRDFLIEHKNQINDISELRCAFLDNTVSTLTLDEMAYSVLCPYTQSVEIIITLSSVGFVLVMITIASSIFYYKHKMHILAFLYTHANSCYMLFGYERPCADQKLYDCFISYSSSDREMALTIVAKLEDPIHCTFCIHERNWMSGKFITTNIIESVQNSRKTLIILSENFLKSEWFHLEFQAAYHQTLKDKKDRLILVLTGDLPDKSEMEIDLQYVISSKTYLQWGERWFWEKLRYSIYEENDFIVRRNSNRCRQLLSCLWKKNAEPQDFELSEAT